MPDSYAEQRQQMVKEQLMPRGIFDPLVLKSFAKVEREYFIPEDEKSYAYEDGPLPIGEGQTISQPYIVALMTQAAELDEDSIVLEIGTGSGYQAAILSHICRQVYTIERFPDLAESAKKCFQHFGYTNIKSRVGDGTHGWQEHAPYDAIITTAAAPDIPKSLAEQLKIGGRLLIPIGDPLSQKLEKVTRLSEEEFEREVIEYVRFVPLIGEEGW